MTEHTGFGRSVALFRAALPRVLGDDHQPEHLRPVGHDVAEDLPGLAVDIASDVDRYPDGAGQYQHERQGVLDQEPSDPNMK